ncbi:MAG: toxic anion resistance protein [Xanthomonadales bacterium]|nr:toxic anion resistance protein [Xanthomonadales bacterium]
MASSGGGSRELEPDTADAEIPEAPARPAVPVEHLELDLADLEAIAYFGKKPQQRLSRASRRMLRLVQRDGTIKAGDALDAMLTIVKGFDAASLDPNAGGLWARLTGRGGLAPLLQALDGLLSQVEHAALDLERHKTALLTEIVAMDRLGDQCHQGLAEIGAFRRHAMQVLDQSLADEARYHLLQRTEDLALSEQVGQQALATLRLSQRSGRELMSRINHVLEITLPLWRQHMTQLVALWRQNKAREVLARSVDAGQSLADASRQLADARRLARQELQAGRYDLRAIETANSELQSNIERGLALAGELEKAREQAAELAGQHD